MFSFKKSLSAFGGAAREVFARAKNSAAYQRVIKPACIALGAAAVLSACAPGQYQDPAFQYQGQTVSFEEQQKTASQLEAEARYRAAEQELTRMQGYGQAPGYFGQGPGYGGFTQQMPNTNIFVNEMRRNNYQYAGSSGNSYFFRAYNGAEVKCDEHNYGLMTGTFECEGTDGRKFVLRKSEISGSREYYPK